MKSPDFIHIGPGRTGTTYIFKMLGQHPGINLPNEKEINFFNRNYSKGLDWYFKKFPEGGLTGEFTNLYFYHPEYVELIRDELKDIKVITVMRNPFDRMMSNFMYQKRSGSVPPNMSFNEALEKYPDLGDQDKFGIYLKQYQEWFGDRLFAGVYDDLSQNPDDFYKRLFNFLGLDTVQLEGVDDKVNQSVALKSSVLAAPIRLGANAMRKLGMVGMLDNIKNSSFTRSILYKKAQKDAVEYPEWLRMNINADIDRLTEVLERDLSHWKK